MREARIIQSSLMPTAPLCDYSIEIAFRFTPFFEVGGDFVDFLRLPDGLVGLYLGDVVGKGLPATMYGALVMGTLRGIHKNLNRDVAVIVWGEFGRTPRVNTLAGRDHWPAAGSAILAGGDSDRATVSRHHRGQARTVCRRQPPRADKPVSTHGHGSRAYHSGQQRPADVLARRSGAGARVGLILAGPLARESRRLSSAGAMRGQVYGSNTW